MYGGAELRAIICDDNEQVCKEYSKKLSELAKKHDINFELEACSSGRTLLFKFEEPNFSVDVIFLDIHMPEMTGEEVAIRLRELGYENEIIFLTVSEKHFFHAFNVDALHYIVKGKTSDEDFELVFLKSVKAIEEKNQEYVLFTAGGETRNILVRKIKYFEVFKKLITVYYDDTSFRFYSSLDKLEKQLEPFGFFRVHKSYLISLNYIEKITSKEVILRDETVLPVGRKNYTLLKSRMTYNSVSKG